jgi:CTD small phosphatase-like protein 2
LNAPNSYVAKSAASDVNNSRYESDLVVILDMDECLIHSQFLSPQNAQFFAYQLLKQQGKTHRFTNNAGDGGQPQQHQPPRRVDTIRFTLPDGDLVHVNLRPGLSEFLKAVTAKYETHIFTAAMNIYADPLLDQLDPTGTMLAGRWYREHCVYDPARQVYIKDLDRLVPLLRRSSTSTGSSPSLSAAASSLLSRVVLVDNNPLSFLANPSNGILVSSFYNDPGDTSLQNVWQLLQELDRQQDVRPHLERRFGLKSALAKLLGKDKKSQSQGQTSRTQHEPHHRCVQQVQSA